MPDWLDDLALESVAPPPVWLPNRAARLAAAASILRRRFGLARGPGRGRGHVLVDAARGTVGFGMSRVVSAAEVEREVEDVLTTINPPVAQGWIVASGALAAIVAALGLPALMAAPLARLAPELVAVAGPIVVWLILLCAADSRQWTIWLDDSGVRMRTWLGRWLRRPARALGSPVLLRARLPSPLILEIETPDALIEVSLALWPHTARQDLVDDMPLWGVGCEFGRHRHRPERRRHRHDRHAGTDAEAADRPA
jgi:hypothetical protein